MVSSGVQCRTGVGRADRGWAGHSSSRAHVPCKRLGIRHSWMVPASLRAAGKVSHAAERAPKHKREKLVSRNKRNVNRLGVSRRVSQKPNRLSCRRLTGHGMNSVHLAMQAGSGGHTLAHIHMHTHTHTHTRTHKGQHTSVVTQRTTSTKNGT